MKDRRNSTDVPSLNYVITFYLFSCLVQSRLRVCAEMHYFMIRLSMSRSVEPIKDDVVFSGLSFSLAYVGVYYASFTFQSN